MLGLEKIGSDSVKEAVLGGQLLITEFFGQLHTFASRFNGLTIRVFDKDVFSLHFGDWTPKA